MYTPTRKPISLRVGAMCTASASAGVALKSRAALLAGIAALLAAIAWPLIRIEGMLTAEATNTVDGAVAGPMKSASE